MKMREKPRCAPDQCAGVSKMFRQFLRFATHRFLVAAIVCGVLAQTAAAGQAASTDGKGLKPILEYISTAWDTLTRSMTDCQSLADPKMKVPPVLYLPAGMPEPAAVHKLSSECNVRVEH